jgi:Fur family transcriptional regulator, ferric uptake regulator
MDETVLERVRESLQEFLTSKGMRRTIQREAIIDAAFGTKEHFTAEELLSMARRIEKSVSRATVYRTLPLLVQSGLLHELDLGSDTKIYDPQPLDLR